jgi:hypothetical protein
MAKRLWNYHVDVIGLDGTLIHRGELTVKGSPSNGTSTPPTWLLSTRLDLHLPVGLLLAERIDYTGKPDRPGRIIYRLNPLFGADGKLTSLHADPVVRSTRRPRPNRGATEIQADLVGGAR